VVLALENEQRELFEELVPGVAVAIKVSLVMDREEELKTLIVDLTAVADSVPRSLKSDS
jgi:hypothetical protein